MTIFRKEYKSVQKYRDKYFPHGLPEPKRIDHKNFKNLIVSLPSTTIETGSKNYNIGDKYNDLGKYYTRDLGNDLKDDYVLIYIRKAERFLAACKKWNSDRLEYEKWLKDREITAKKWIELAKKKYNSLKKDKNINTAQLEVFNHKYKRLPSSVRVFIKDIIRMRKI